MWRWLPPVRMSCGMPSMVLPREQAPVRLAAAYSVTLTVLPSAFSTRHCAKARQPRVVRPTGCFCTADALPFGKLVVRVHQPLEGLSERGPRTAGGLAWITRRVESVRADPAAERHLVGIEPAGHEAVAADSLAVPTERTVLVRSVGLTDRRRR